MSESTPQTAFWLPISEIFSVKNSAYERMNNDAFHSYFDQELNIVKMLMHYLKYAPKVKKSEQKLNELQKSADIHLRSEKAQFSALSAQQIIQ